MCKYSHSKPFRVHFEQCGITTGGSKWGTCSAPDVMSGVGSDALDDPGLEKEITLLLELVGPRHRTPHGDGILS